MERWFQAAGSNDIQFIQANLERFTKSQDQLFNNKTALHIASQAGFIDIIKILYSQEKDIKSSSGMTALHYAVQSGQLQAVKLLLDLKDIKSNKGKLPIELAEDKGFLEIVQLLKGEQVENNQQMRVDEELLRLNDQLRIQNLEITEKAQAYERENKIYKAILTSLGQEFRDQKEDDVIEFIDFEEEERIEYLERQMLDMRQELQGVKDIVVKLLMRFDQYFLK
ncbi:Ankyrin repeat-containing protein [Spironucleus salmonicida]|uniref:Ankyrin repeat-containing protein n=1 Tax=Spironucleus salmonicida TaxID=348837 RepID=V6LEA2_9EUKA|nr:Ankyrin repeat-containing protein [Spironucleus salmonicida]|eukprot:EST42802.1 Ankyrin repeat-containing protein [Spironucleus salmonicida]